MATAALLAKNGSRVTLLEKRDALPVEGAGIQLTPNAVHVLKLLGIDEGVEAQAFHPKHLRVKDGVTGRKIVDMPFSDMETRFTAPYLVLHRETLISKLYEQASSAGVEVTFDKPFEMQNDVFDGDGLIGADGVWSSVRQKVFGAKAEPTGRTAYRSVLPTGSFRDEMSISLSPSRHFVKYQVNKTGHTNLVALVKEPFLGTEKGWSEPVETKTVLNHFKNWNSEVRHDIASGSWVRWPLFTVKPGGQWTKNNIALVGDAAHAMVPFLAQGGGAALEDAATLVHMVTKHENVPTAFSAYQAARKPRVTKIWQEARTNGERYHWPAPLAQARNIGLKVMGGERLLQRYSWIYEWRPPQFPT